VSLSSRCWHGCRSGAGDRAGHLLQGVAVPFVRDIETHVRLLV
jgi:hypothetical protein